MQKRRALLLIVPLLMFALLPAAALADEGVVNSTELIDHAADYDGKTVVYEGEAIGDILYRGEYAWIAVSDGGNTVGCYVAASDAKKIAYLGRYGVTGDTVRIVGVFHRVCAEHGGDMDLHADSFEIVRLGSSAEQKCPKTLVVAACLLPLPAAALLVLAWKRKS